MGTATLRMLVQPGPELLSTDAQYGLSQVGTGAYLGGAAVLIWNDITPEGRAELSALLQRTFFKPTTTFEQSQITLLGLFCCPRQVLLPSGRPRNLDRLALEKEMRDAINALPPHERELRPAPCFPSALLEPLGKGDAGAGKVLPHVLHFCAHSAHDGIFMDRDGSDLAYKLAPGELVQTLRECFKLSHVAAPSRASSGGEAAEEPSAAADAERLTENELAWARAIRDAAAAEGLACSHVELVQLALVHIGRHKEVH